MSGPKGKEKNINMKIRVFAIVAFAFIINGNAQNTEVKIECDTARLRVVYVFSQNYSIDESFSRIDTMALDIGDKLSVFHDMTAPNKTIDKYFGFLTRLDNNSKKRLIIKLTESIEIKEDNSFNLNSLFGAWEDTRDSDEIIRDIRESRVEKNDLEAL